MPRVERFSLGLKIDLLFLDTLELLRKATFAQINQKIEILDEALGKIDSLRFFIQLVWEIKLISNNQFGSLGISVENIGKMVGGWKKGLLTKTSARAAEERKE